MVEFMPISLTGRSSATNSISMSTAKLTILTRLETCFGKAIDQFGVEVEETCKVAVSTFITTDEFFAKTEAGHKPALLEPKYGAEREPGKDDLDSGDCNHLFSKTGADGFSRPLRAQLSLCWTHGNVLIACSGCNFSVGPLRYVSRRSEHVLL
jgi:hypothetical protein